MKKLFLLVVSVTFTQLLTAQIVGGIGYLQGKFLEIGVNQNGSFGTGSTAPPSGYHPSTGSTAPGGLGETYDFGHDGWTTGSPSFFADYTNYGAPYEGWFLESGTTMNSFIAMTSSGFGTGASTVAYSNRGGTAILDQSGSAFSGQLVINSETRVDTFASWVLVKIRLQNVGSTPLSNVYYMRASDPDNNNTYVTHNRIKYQGDSVHGTLVFSTTTPTGASSPTYFGLGTRDPRAKAFVCAAAPVTANPSAIFAGGISGYSSAPSYSGGGDAATGIVFKMGTLAPGAITSLSYAYMFDDTASIDTLFPVVFGSLHDSFEVDLRHYCNGPDLTDHTLHFHPGSWVKTWWGDGAVDTSSLIPGFGTGVTSFSHYYDLSGSYTLKQVLYIGTAPVDSVHITYNHVRCTGIPISFYLRNDNNCTMDSLEYNVQSPVSIAVDSNGVTIDTVSCISGLYYSASGGPGDIYTFRVISLPAGCSFACPATGMISDTITSGTYAFPTQYIGFQCDSVSVRDLGISSVARSGRHSQSGTIYAYNESCTPANATVTLYHSPKYHFDWAIPAPAATTYTKIIWNLSGLSNTDSMATQLSYGLEVPATWLTPGDTVHTYIAITPNDADSSNNIVFNIDTVKSSYDPNYIAVSGSNNVSGTQLKYTISFENTGNDTAFNIHIMDTLSDDLDVSTCNMLGTSNTMFLTKIKWAGHTILRFDFPDINLLDSSHHGRCDGMVSYSINTRPGLPICYNIYNRAGIYFDDNEVVMTNTATGMTACWPASTPTSSLAPDIKLYPNPTNDLLHIDNVSAVTTYRITDILGATKLQGLLQTGSNHVSLSFLAHGLYLVELTDGQGYRRVEKVTKD